MLVAVHTSRLSCREAGKSPIFTPVPEYWKIKVMRFRNLDDADVKGKRVLVRVDLNVPIHDGEVTDISRIERNAPTITEISDRGGKVILLSHYRPKGRDPKESLKPVAAAVARIIGRPVTSPTIASARSPNRRSRA